MQDVIGGALFVERFGLAGDARGGDDDGLLLRDEFHVSREGGGLAGGDGDLLLLGRESQVTDGQPVLAGRDSADEEAALIVGDDVDVLGLDGDLCACQSRSGGIGDGAGDRA